MADLREEVQSNLQRLADEVSLQGRHILAQRFIIQALYTVLHSNGSLKTDGLIDPVKSMAVGILGANGRHPDPAVFDIFMNMLDGQQADILPFKAPDPSISK